MIAIARSLAAAALLVGVAGLAAAPADAGSGWTSYVAVAEADGLDVGLSVPGAPLDDRLLDGGAPRAQALLDSLGTSTAFSAAPWPGELVANAPGLITSATGVPLPAYPLVASASFPATPTTSQAYGPVVLTADSAANSSRSTGRITQQGGVAGQVDSAAAVSQSKDLTLNGTAGSRVQSLRVGPLVLADVDAEVAVTRRPDGELTRRTSLRVLGASVAGQAVELSPDGFLVAGNKVPLGPTDPLLGPLAAQGITVRWVRASKTKDGAISPGIEISVTRPVSLAGNGLSTVIYTVGRAASSIPARPAAPAALVPLASSVPTAAAQVAAVPVSSSRLSPTAAAVPDVRAAPAAPAVPAAALGPALRSAAQRWPTFYVPLIIVALLGIAAVLSLRGWGVRGLWQS